MTFDPTHPLAGAKESAGKVFDLAKENPIGIFILGMSLLALIIPPRKRKYKPKKKYHYKRKKGTTKTDHVKGHKKRKTKKSKVQKVKQPVRSLTVVKHRKSASISKKQHSSVLPAYRIKGSPEAVAYMANLRAKRNKKRTRVT